MSAPHPPAASEPPQGGPPDAAAQRNDESAAPWTPAPAAPSPDGAGLARADAPEAAGPDASTRAPGAQRPASAPAHSPGAEFHGEALPEVGPLDERAAAAQDGPVPPWTPSAAPPDQAIRAASQPNGPSPASHTATPDPNPETAAMAEATPTPEHVHAPEPTTQPLAAQPEAGAPTAVLATEPASAAAPETTSGGPATPTALPARKKRRPFSVRVMLAAVISLVLVLTVGVAAGAWAFSSALHASYPQTSGTLHIAGLKQAVTVGRDADGITQIYAPDPDDLFLAQGYVQAQDRFWQMDVDRHIASGTLASLFGPSQLSTDEFIRTMGWRETAEQSYALLSPATKAYLQAFSQGVNDYLAAHPGGSSLSIEYTILGLPGSPGAKDYHPAQWTPIDTLCWLQAMSWDLVTNLFSEVSRSLLTDTLSSDQIDQLYPSYPYGQNPTIVSQGALVGSTYKQNATPTAALPKGAQQQLADLSNLLSQVPSVLGTADASDDGVGSNSWVVSGKLTTTGEPLLANDPHLAPQLPSIWYQIGLHCTTVDASCPFNATGFAFAPMPGVVIGHNQDIAWGFTDEFTDVADLYLEKIDGSDYLYDGREYPLTEHKETIAVAGQSPVTITVRSTKHGPLISDVNAEFRTVGKDAPAARAGDPAEGAAPGIQYGVALEWTALQPNTTMNALFELDSATDWTQFRAAAADFTVPAQNMIYADTKGNIGYQAPGRIPVRKSGDGRWPVPGWTDQYDWTGYIPFSALPNEYDPTQGYIVTANNAIVGPTYPYTLTTDWDYGYRAAEITKDIQKYTANGGKISVADMAAIQTDTYNSEAALIVPYLLKLKVNAFTQPAQNLLKGWNFTQPASSGAAAYYNEVYAEILKLTFGNKLPSGISQSELQFDGGDRWFAVLQSIMTEPDSTWWDNAKTPARETRDSVLTAAMEKAAIDLTEQLGKNVAGWSWGRLHTLTLQEPTLGTSGPAVVRWLLDGRTEQLGGGTSLVDATSWDLSSGNFEVTGATSAPSMRMIVDLADFDDSRWVNLTGESGHVGDPDYLNQAPLWAAGKTLPWAFSSAAVKASIKQTLTLEPQT